MERETGGKTAMAERARSFSFWFSLAEGWGALALGGKPGEQGKALLVRGGVTVRRRWWLEKGSGQGRRKSQNQKGCGCIFCFAKWVQPAGLEEMGF
jgi:hypothetical protein